MLRKYLSGFFGCGLLSCSESAIQPCVQLSMQLLKLIALCSLCLLFTGCSQSPPTADEAIDAVYNDDVATIEAYIQSGGDVDVIDDEGYALLHIACWNSGTSEIVKMLIDAGADINACASLEQAPLHLASMQSDPELVRVLLDAGADLNLTTSEGASPLMLAASFGSDPDVVRLLIERGASIEQRSESGATPLMYGVTYNRNFEVLDALLELGAELKVVDNNGLSPMHFALEEGNVSTIQWLESKGVSLDLDDKYGRNTLHVAAEFSSDIDLIRYIVDQGTDVNSEMPDGSTALLLASGRNPNIHVVQFLLMELGADVTKCRDDGFSPLMAAGENAPDAGFIDLLVEAGADVNDVTDEGRTALMWAVSNNDNHAVADALIALGADIHARASGDYEGMSVLAFATRYPDCSCMAEELFRMGARVDSVDMYGNTPVDYAEENEAFEGLGVLEQMRAKAQQP